MLKYFDSPNFRLSFGQKFFLQGSIIAFDQIELITQFPNKKSRFREELLKLKIVCGGKSYFGEKFLTLTLLN